ncbi:hypothetical protein HK102_012548 [Quaeritorhiza haematococci]|nr:hypothetical protein HK102_012548 [Quaeritorhiza haematococci]
MGGSPKGSAPEVQRSILVEEFKTEIKNEMTLAINNGARSRRHAYSPQENDNQKLPDNDDDAETVIVEEEDAESITLDSWMSKYGMEAPEWTGGVTDFISASAAMRVSYVMLLKDDFEKAKLIDKRCYNNKKKGGDIAKGLYVPPINPFAKHTSNDDNCPRLAMNVDYAHLLKRMIRHLEEGKFGMVDWEMWRDIAEEYPHLIPKAYLERGKQDVDICLTILQKAAINLLLMRGNLVEAEFLDRTQQEGEGNHWDDLMPKETIWGHFFTINSLLYCKEFLLPWSKNQQYLTEVPEPQRTYSLENQRSTSTNDLFSGLREIMPRSGGRGLKDKATVADY